MTQAVPKDFSTITPTLILENCMSAIELYKSALGATEDYCMKTPDGKVMHACLTIGSSKLFLSDPFPGCDTQSTTARFYLYVEDADASLGKAIAGGMKQTMPAEDMFWGDRLGSVQDRYGINWSIATHVRDVSDAEMEKAKNEWLTKMKQGGKAA